MLALIGMSGPRLSIVINHSIRKALWKIVPWGYMGWFMQVMLNRLLPSSPAPSGSLFTSGFWHWYIVLVFPPGIKRHPFPLTFPSTTFLGKASKQRSATILMAQKDLNSHLCIFPLDMERKVIAGAKTDSWTSECGIVFPFPWFVNFTAKFYSAYLNFFSSPLLRGIQLAKRLEQQLFFFFAQL